MKRPANLGFTGLVCEKCPIRRAMHAGWSRTQSVRVGVLQHGGGHDVDDVEEHEDDTLAAGHGVLGAHKGKAHEHDGEDGEQGEIEVVPSGVGNGGEQRRHTHDQQDVGDVGAHDVADGDIGVALERSC